MIDVEEENILIESRDFSYNIMIYPIECDVFITVYDKIQGKTIAENHKVGNIQMAKTIRRNVCKPVGTIIKQGKMKFIIRNHDKCVWSEDEDIAHRLTRENSSKGNPYDNRYDGELSLFSNTIPFLKLAWINI